MTNSTRPGATLQRAHLPEVMFAADLAHCLDIPPDQAAEGLRSGLFGPSFLVAGRPAVLRADFYEALRLRAVQGDRAAREVLPRRPEEHDG